MKEIIKYEHELEKLISADKNTWTRFAVLMGEIENKELYKDLGLKSFTAWVKDFALKHKIHESVLWNRKKAGKVYNNYVKNQEAKGVTVAPLEHANVGVDTLVLLDKITKKNPELGAELTDKAINKEITRDDLRTAYKVIRGDISNRNHSKHNNELNDKSTKQEDNNNIDENVTTENVTAAKIVNALNNTAWLGVVKQKKHFKGAYEQDKYKAITEFPVFTGTSKKSRRIDVLIAENLRCDNHFSLNLHGIEIKVSKSDFLNDDKYTEYGEFVNYLWIAVPESLIDIVIENAPITVGILSFKNETISIHREATRLDPLMIQSSLITLSLKLI